MITRPVRPLAELARPQRSERGRLAASVALAVGAAAAGIALMATSGYLISRAAQRPEILSLMVTIVAVRAFGITRALCRYGERLASHDLALRQLSRLRERFFMALEPRVPGSAAARSGDLLSRFVADVDTLRDLYLRVIIPVLVAAAVTAGASAAAFLILPAAALEVLAALAAAAVLLPWLSGVVTARAMRRQAAARARVTSELVEGLDGAPELALAGRSQDWVGRIGRSDARLAAIARRDGLASAGAVVAGGLLCGAGILGLLLVAIPAVRSGAMPGVLLAALVFLLMAAYESVLPLSASARRAQACASAAERLHEIELAPVEIMDPQVPVAAPEGGALEVRGAWFRYGEGEPWVLRGASLRIAPGAKVALMGPSGAGKSTLGELLVRFRDPQEGAVALGGVDLRDLSQCDVRAAVTLCAQDSHVFNTSVRENLLLADRSASEARLLEVLAAVELDGWVGAQAAGLDTLVGQAGELLSGGQRRRLALARALLSPAPVLILDEPTAHLDGALGRRVMGNLLRLCEDRAVLVITHDTAALEGFDEVVRLRHGALQANAQPLAVALG